VLSKSEVHVSPAQIRFRSSAFPPRFVTMSATAIHGQTRKLVSSDLSGPGEATQP